MANQYTEIIEQLRDQSDKDSNKQALYEFYLMLPNNGLKAQFTQELIEQFEDLIELFHYRHLHDYI
ncbi:hypothetical protein [Lonepinella koalarum]|uniref:Uncharacterized protein n=1 Tax=Lonepinella koalarum TaxID=53417 RepID=A0A4V2PUE9_9PAST|nr:hypothetical protein [Lonepinella koalarum]MDH2927887.1 hypothetical protein [Lonepinella koalarum]TCK70081.1 hypothetical protein EV692_1307 [Lonepinella koalarum]TFJ90322.1 hypothetical protein E0709_02985 [Lonepinella koalarum]